MNKFEFDSKIWLYNNEKGVWHFATLPQELAHDINSLYSDKKRGWGSLKVKVKIGESSWKTSIFPDKKSNSYLLPIKKSIRNAEQIEINALIKFEIEIL